MYNNKCMNDNTTLGINHTVTFFNGSNICNSRYINFNKGNYSIEYLNKYFSNPVLAKIGPSTKLTLYFNKDMIKQNNVMVYNNSYSDRVVVIKLPNKKITSFEVSIFRPMVEKIDYASYGIYFSITDIIFIFLIMILFSYLCQ